VPETFEQLPEETSKAYAAFVEYLRLGPQRSMEVTAQNLQKSVGTLRHWSERHAWVARARAYDAFSVQTELELAAVALRSKAVDWARRQDKVREDEFAAAEEAIELCREKMRELRGRSVEKMTLGDIAKLLDVASKLARLSTGMETDRKEVTGKDGGPVKVEVDVAPLIKRVYGSVSVGGEQPVNNAIGMGSEAAASVIDLISEPAASEAMPGRSVEEERRTEKKPE
jgi:hypothetical protein